MRALSGFFARPLLQSVAMTTDNPRVRPRRHDDEDAYRARVLGRVRRLAHALDSAFRIPGTRIRFGYDSLLGLIPGVGDILGGVLAIWIIVRAARLGAPRGVLFKMGLNVGLDAVAGSVPIVGDVADVAFRANQRNVALLERWLAVSTDADAPERPHASLPPSQGEDATAA